MGNIHRAITESVNEVYMKASSELMKNNDFGVHGEQLDSLIREQSVRALGIDKMMRTKGCSRICYSILQSSCGLVAILEKWNMLGFKTVTPHKERGESAALGHGLAPSLGLKM
jgi:hypothetical protein